MDATTHIPFDRYLFDFRKNKYSNQNHYYYFKNGFSEEECGKILKSFAKFCKNESLVFGNSKSSTRTSKIFWIPRNDDTRWIYDKIVNYAAVANQEMFGFDLTGLRDTIQLTLYEEENQGRYDNHIDLGANDEYSCRKLSVSVQLSYPESYEGGNVVLDNKHHFPRGVGDVMVFSAFTTHRVNPVTKGKRYSLVLWIYGPPFK